MTTEITTITELKRRNAEIGHFFFSKDTMKFFKSKIESKIIDGKYFITSEVESKIRVYKIREFKQTGEVINNPFGESFFSNREAKAFLKDLKVNANRFEFKNLVVTAKLHAEGVKFPNSELSDRILHNHFKVTVKNTDSKTRISFDFYGSYADWQNGVIELCQSDLKHALYSFISDSEAGTKEFEEFCSELGYDTDSRKAEKIHKACIKSFEKLEKLGISESEMYDYLNELND